MTLRMSTTARRLCFVSLYSVCAASEGQSFAGPSPTTTKLVSSCKSYVIHSLRSGQGRLESMEELLGVPLAENVLSSSPSDTTLRQEMAFCHRYSANFLALARPFSVPADREYAPACLRKAGSVWKNAYNQTLTVVWVKWAFVRFSRNKENLELPLKQFVLSAIREAFC